jgi:phage gp36-like protein
MVIRHSNQLLEKLTEVEERIKMIERIMEECGIDCDQEQLLRALLAKRYPLPFGQ